jgi:YihY family inner membrane protein
MRVLTPSAQRVLAHPLGFVLRVIRGFAASQCLLLAGAIAYYALLSLVPLLILSVILLSQLVDQQVLVETIAHYLEWLVPSQSQALLGDLSGFLERRTTIGLVLLGTILFFSSLAFSVVEKSMEVIFKHRVVERSRHPLISAILPYSFVLMLVVLLFVVTTLFIILQALAGGSIELLGHSWSLQGLYQPGFYLLGLGVETLIFAALYMIMPVGRTRPSHALIGGITAALLWEATRHGLTWYFTTLSKASILYGSLTTSVVVLFSMEIAATLLLLGAQVIAEYERIGLE